MKHETTVHHVMVDLAAALGLEPTRAVHCAAKCEEGKSGWLHREMTNAKVLVAVHH